MNDQIIKMPKYISAACINSYHTQEQRNMILQAFNNGCLNVLMISPERLFLESVDFPGVSLICIDEAHCISEWSHNFRPSYLRIEGILKEKVPKLPKLALTATATLKTVESVSQALDIKSHAVIRTTAISRTNLTATVTRDTDKAEALIRLLRSEKYKNIRSIIVYCTYKRTTERVRKFLKDNGISAEAYHAGMSDIERQNVYKEFEENNIRVLVATIAFGMGIDKKDIQGIIHFDMPKSIENYLQEIGRAGRDGEHAYCHLFLSDADLFEIRKLIFLDHVDMEQLSKIMNRVMSSAYSKWQESSSNKEKRFAPRKRKRDELEEDNLNTIQEDITLDKGVYIALPLKELCKQLDIKEQVIITILSRGEKESKGNEYYKFYGILPEVCNIRFYKQGLEELAEQDKLFAAIKCIGREYTGKCKVNLLDLAEELNISPLSVPKELFLRQCQHKITYDAETECFCIEVFKIVKDMEWLEKKVLEHMWRVEDNFLSKLSAAYILFRKSSYPSIDYILKQEKKEEIAEKLENSSNLIHALNNQYFDCIEDKCEELLAGSKDEKEIINPIAHFQNPTEEIEAIKDVRQVLDSCADNIGRTDILKILIGIGTSKIQPTAYTG